MSQYLTMWLRGAGPAKRAEGDLKSGDLFFANAIPLSFGVLHEAAEREGVLSIFDYAEGHDEAKQRAEIEVYGKPEDELDDDDPEITDEMLARVNLRASEIGPWYEPADGLESVRALLRFLQSTPNALSEGGPFAASIPDELRAFETALHEAQKRGTQFRLRWSR